MGEPVSQTKRAAASSTLQPKTSDGLASEEESDDLSGMGLVTYSRETGSSSSSSPYPNDLPESVENLPTTEADTIIVSENVPIDGGFPDLDTTTEEPPGEIAPEQNVSTRPQRQSRPPQILTYSSLGNPGYQRFNSTVNCVQIPWMPPPTATVPPQGPLYSWNWSQMPCLPPFYC